MQERRVVGIDLGITSAHAVAVCDASGKVLAKRRAHSTRESLLAVEQAALVDLAEGRLEFVLEPTGPAWLPVAVFFIARGHVVYRISSAKAADMRRFLKRHAKTNAIDAAALAKVAIVDRESLIPLELPDADLAALDRRLRAADSLTHQIGERKTRIRDLARHVMPLVDEVFTNKLGKADLDVLERYGDPRALVRLGAARLARFIARASKGQHGAVRAEAWIRVARAAIEVFAHDAAVPFDAIAAELASEVRILRVLIAERDAHAEAREDAYRKLDPTGLVRTLPGVATTGGPVLATALYGRHFANGGAFRSYTGLTPPASGTGDAERKGTRMSKAGSVRLRDQLVWSANVARTLDPQLAAVYWTQMVERGAHHTKAICVVASRLALRAHAVVTRGEPYVIRDLDGTPVTAEHAKAIIAEHYTVPDDVRRRRRTGQPRTRTTAPTPT